MAKKTQAEIEFKVVDDGLKSELKDVSASMTKSRQEMKLTSEQMKENGSETDKLEANLGHLKTQYDAQSQAVNIVSQRLANAQKYFGENSTEAQKYEKQLRSAQIYQQQLSNKITETSSALAAAKGDTSTYAGAMATLQSAQRKVAAEQAASTAEFKKWEATAGQTATEAEKLAKAQDYAGQQSKLAASQVDLLKQALSKTQTEFGETSTEALQMKAKLAQAETAMANLGNQAKQVDTTNLDDIGDKLDVSNLMDAADAVGEIGDKIKEVGGQAVEMANGVSNASFKVANGAQTMGLSMKDAEGHITAISETGVGSIEEVGDAVSTTANQVQDLNETDLNTLTESGMNLEQIFGSDMDETMRGVNALMQNYGLTAQQAMDLMVKGTQEGLDKTHELGDNMAEYSQLWSQMGFSAQDTFGILQNGLKSGAYNLDKVNDFVKEFGVSLSDGRIEENIGKFSKGTQDLFKQYKNGKATASQVFKSLITDLGKSKNKQDALSTASTIWSSLGEDNAMKVITSLTKTNTAFDNTSGAADKLNQKAKDNNQWQASLTKMKDSLIPIGETIKEVLQPILDWISSMAGGFAKLSDPVKKLIVIIGSIVAAILPVMAIVTKVVSIFSSFGALFAADGALAFATPALAAIGSGIAAIAAPVAAVIAAVVAVIAVIKNWGAISKWLEGVWSGVSDFFSGLWDGIKSGASNIWGGVQDAWSAAVDGVKGVWSSITSFFSGLWQGIVDTVQPVLQTIGEVFQVGFMLVESVVQGVWLFITSIFQAGLNNVQSVMQFISDGWSAIWNAIWGFVQPILTNVWNFITTTFNNIVTTIQTVLQPVVNFISGVWTSISTTTSNVWTAITNWLSNTWTSISTTVSNVWNTIAAFFSSVWNKISGVVSAAVSRVASLLNAAWNNIKAVTSAVWNAISGVISGVWASIKSAASAAANWVKSVVSTAWNGVKSISSSVWNAIKSVINSVWSGIKSGVSSAVNSVRSVVSSVWNGIRSVTSSVWNSIKNAITGPINAAKSTVSRAISAIKGFFSGLHLSLPKIHMPALPHFHLTGSFSLKPPSVPHLAVDWYAKGGVMQKPTMFGMNGSSPMVGGEKGAEAILPLNKQVLGTIGDAIAAATSQKTVNSSSSIYNITFNNTIASDYDTNALFRKADQWLGDKQARSNFGVRGNA